MYALSLYHFILTFVVLYIQSIEAAEKQVKTEQRGRPLTEVVDYLADNVVHETVHMLVRELLAETIQEGITRKLEKQDVVGIYFPKPKWLQISAYSDMLLTWQSHKTVLEDRIIAYEDDNNEVFSEIEEEIMTRTNAARNKDVASVDNNNPTATNTIDMTTKINDTATTAVTDDSAAVTLTKEEEENGDKPRENNDAEATPKEVVDGQGQVEEEVGGEVKVIDDEEAIRARQKELEIEKQNKKRALLISKMKKNRLSMDTRELEHRRLKEQKIKEEQARQAKLILEMMIEEKICRDFYKYETSCMLTERRNMREEDEFSDLLREEYNYQQAILRYKGGSENNEEYQKRRMMLKKMALERRQKELERALMIIEDSCGSLMREEDNQERQRALLLYQQSKFNMDSDSDDDNLLFPEWLHRPAAWDDWDATKQIKYIKFHKKMRRRYLAVEKKAAQEAEAVLKAQHDSYDCWNSAYIDFEYLSNQSEYEYILVLEDQNHAEHNLLQLQYQLQQFITDCRNKGNEELRLRHEYDVLSRAFTKIEIEMIDCIAWEEKCKSKRKSRDKSKLKIEQECRYIDSKSTTGFHQRFYTDIFRKAIYIQFFQGIVYWMANHAEIIANEKMLMTTHRVMTYNTIYLDERRDGLRQLRKILKRKDCLRLRRSVLNQTYFPKHRHHLLSKFFSSWKRFLHWNKNQRDEYMLNFQVIRNNMILNDIHKDIVDNERKSVNTRDTSAAPTSHFPKQKQNDDNNEEEDNDDDNNDAKKNKNKAKDAIRDYNKRKEPTLAPNQRQVVDTYMDGYQTRPITCLYCHRVYNEAQNHSHACYFHPKPYRFYCPRSCPNPGKTKICANHRCKRWTCCDNTDKSDMGCCNSYHKPPVADPTYDNNASKLVTYNQQEMEHLTNNLKHSRNWQQQLHVTRQEQLQGIETQVTRDRSRVKEFGSQYNKIEVLPDILVDTVLAADSFAESEDSHSHSHWHIDGSGSFDQTQQQNNRSTFSHDLN